MTVSELIEALQFMPQNAPVGYVYDGAHRGDVKAVWLARSGCVLLAEPGHVVYDTEDRPEGSPTKEREPYWTVDR